MQNLVNQILKILKDHVSQNNMEIRYNQDEINRMITEVSDRLSEQDLEYKNSLNKELLQENDEFIQMQLQLSEFMEKFGHLFPADETGESEVLYDSEAGLPYFSRTVNGQIEYGPDHPQFHNMIFFKELLRYYEDREEYEMCDQLIRIKNQG